MKVNQLLPACEPADACRQPQLNPRHHILVAEDDSSLRQLNTEALMNSGYAADTAEDGAAAWQAFTNEHYDLLLTDNNMPKLSGLELVKKLRAARMAVPVIMASQVTHTRTERLQFTATLPKHFAPDELVQMVKEVLHWSARMANNENAFSWAAPRFLYPQTKKEKRHECKVSQRQQP